MNKTTINPLNDVELHIPSDLNSKGDFVITSTYDTVTDIASNYDVRDAPTATQKPRKAITQSKVVSDAIAASKSIVGELKASMAQEAKLITHDLMFRTNWRKAYHQAIRDQREEQFMQELGLTRK